MGGKTSADLAADSEEIREWLILGSSAPES